MALTKTQVSELYVAIFNRASEGTGNTYWQGEGSAAEVAQKMLDTVDAKEYFGTAIDDDKAFIEHIYINTLGKTYAEDAEGIDFWVARLANGESRGEVVAALVVAATDPQYAGTAAQKQFLNRVEVSNYAADTVKDAPANYKQSMGFDGDLTVTDDAATVGAAKGNVDKLAGDKPGVNGKTIELTHKADNLVGTDGDDVFYAAVKQNETGSGALANTLETGDVLDGGAGRDILKADLIASGTISGQNPVISAQTSNIEEVYLRAQNIMGVDQGTNTTARATIDAERMVGVEQWWTENSRADIRIEDVRERPNDVTLGMRLTDPQVNFEVYFNPLFMDGGQLTESNLIIQIAELNGGAVDSVAELKNISVTELAFELDGKKVALATAEMAAANTWAELETALKSALEAAGLGDLQLTRGNDGQFMLFDAKGRVFSEQGGFTAKATTNQQIDIRNRITQDLDVQDQQTEVDIILDGVGNGSLGGNLNVAAMSGSRGVEVFHVEVDRTSHLATMRSDNNPLNNGAFSTEQQLEEVYISHLAGGAKGNLSIGHRTVDANGVSQTTDDRLHDGTGAVGHPLFVAAPAGLSDVRVFDASGFTGALKVGAELTANAFDKYLADAEDTVQFSYLLGDAGSNLNLAVNNTLAGDVDFALEVVGGAGDDRINLSGLAVKQQTSIDGGEGENTLEVNTSTGFAATQNGFDIAAAAGTDLTAAETSFDAVTDIDTVVIGANTVNVGPQANAAAAIAAAAGANLADTTHDVVAGGFDGVSNFVIATNTTVGYTVGGVANTANGNAITDTRLINLDVDTQSVEVSGKNQTLGAGNSDNNQAFGTVRLSDTDGEVLDLALNNTARATGTLTVNTLTIDNTAGNVSEVRTLNLDSVGTRQTSNIVTALNGNLVNTFNLEGTQDLTITNLASAANSTDAVAANIDNLEVNASTLEGDLYLGVSGAVVTAVDAALGTNRTVKLIGTEGESDILNIRDGVTTTNATTISGFETIRFGENATIIAATNFNATNVSDVELYDLVDATAAINLNNLRATENVQINSDNTNGTVVAADVTLAAANPTTGSQINVNFAANTTGGGVDGSFWGLGGANLNVQDFSTISLDMGGIAGDSYDYNFNLNLLANPTTGLINARTLEITGGQYDAGFTNVDSLTLGLLDTALTKVDFSGYAGNFTTAGWDSTKGSNAEVVVNQFGMQFDIGGNNALMNVAAAGGANTAEVNTLDFTAGGGFGNLQIGESITITFAGGQYIFTNDTGAAILEADIDNHIVADAATNAPAAFTVVGGAGDTIVLTATRNGDMDPAVVAGSDVANVPANVTVAETTKGDLLSGVSTKFVTVESEFLTKFTFTEDAATQGVVWQIDNFQPFDGVDNVSLNTQTQIDLRQLGVDSSTKITIEDGATFTASLTAAELAAYDTVNGAGWAAANLVAANTIISSNDDLNFTIVLTGVDPNTLGNENIVGIA